MYIDLTTTVSPDSPLLQWAKAQDNPHIAAGHVGTHLDTYEKRPIPLEYIKSNGVLFDVRGISEVALSQIDLSLVQPSDFVIFRTGQIEQYPYGDPLYFENHPQLSEELIAALLARNIRFIGVDCPGIRQHAAHEAADRLCEQHGVYIIENLIHVSQLPVQKFVLYTMWLDEPQMTGLRCRVIAEC